MSFFRSIRTSITRGRSTSRDTTPVRGGGSNETSRPGSVLGGSSSRRDSMDSRADSLFNRSDTFILNNTSDVDEDREARSQSNSSTLEKQPKAKPSKKSIVLSKFSTFTKRKKTPAPTPATPSPDASTFEHHPSDNATNTYYKWQTSDGGGNGSAPLDYDSQSDPFNFLYEQQSSLKALQNGTSNGSGTPTSAPATTPAEPTFDSSTYRKGKMPTQLRERLEQLKTGAASGELREADETATPSVGKSSEADKYKTITLNSFRRSFRERLLQQQKEAPHNPAWFVAVEAKPTTATTATSTPTSQQPKEKGKENRPDFLVFENDNYRPGSRSPVRERPTSLALSSSTASSSALNRQSRSPIKRNETFRVERPFTPIAEHQVPSGHTAPSIRVEFKNSIAPHMPGRLVPVGVAKPMPSSYAGSGASSAATPHSVSTPLKNWSTTTVTPTKTSPTATATTPPSSGVERSRAGRYQTLVQIRNEANSRQQLSQPPPYQPPPATSSHLRAPPTRVQLGGDFTTTTTATKHSAKTLSPLLQQRRLQTPGTRYSLAATPTSGGGATTTTTPTTPQQLLNSYELFKRNLQQQQQQRHKSTPATTATARIGGSGITKPPTYFGGNISNNTSANHHQNSSSANYTRPYGMHSKSNVGSGLYTNTNNVRNTTTIKLPTRSYAYGIGSDSGSGGGSAYYPSQQLHNHHQHQQQQQHNHQTPRQRVIVPTQRRSRSPIKMPWR